MSRNPITITSLDDPQVDAFRDVRDKDLRGRDHLFMAESELVLRRLLRVPNRLHSIFLSHNKYERMAGDLAELPASIPIYVTDIDLMTEIAGFHIHRGVLAAGYRLARDELSLDQALRHLKARNNCLLIIAEGLTNVDNMGGLFRNAAAFGVDGIILDPTCCDPLYRKAIRVSMGHALSIPYAIVQDWPGELIKLKQNWGVSLFGAENTPAAKPLWNLPKQQKLGMIFGSEGHGLSTDALAMCDEIYHIPMKEGVPSLNVANASAVFLYEQCRFAASVDQGSST